MSLPKRVALYIPHNVSGDLTLREDVPSHVNDIVKRLTIIGGGATVYPVIGTYISESGLLITERLSVVEVFSKNDRYHELISAVMEEARLLKALLDQERVSVLLNGELHLI